MIFVPIISGHYLDQKRLKQGLYRHPWDDISYVLPEHMSM
jgi:ATP citrate (pro-S)-lyase